MSEKLDVQFFKPFIEGTLNTLKVQCKMDARSEKPFMKKRGQDNQQARMHIAIAGVIGITSPKFNGSISLCFTEKVFLGMMEQMLGEKFPEITDDLQDGVAELLNIIFGHAKVILNQQGHAIQKAIPTVLRGENLQTTYFSNNPVVVLPFVTSLGEFQIEICSEIAL